MVSLLERGFKPFSISGTEVSRGSEFNLPRREPRDYLLKTYNEVSAPILEARTARFDLDYEYYLAKRIPRMYFRRANFDWKEIDALFDAKFPDSKPPRNMVEKDFVLGFKKYGVKIGNPDTNFSISIDMNVPGPLWNTEVAPLYEDKSIAGDKHLVNEASVHLSHDWQFRHYHDYNRQDRIQSDFEKALSVLDIVNYSVNEARIFKFGKPSER